MMVRALRSTLVLLQVLLLLGAFLSISNAAPVGSNIYALLVKQSSTPKSPKSRALQGTANDLVLTRDLLGAYRVPADHIRVLEEQKATREAIVGGFHWLQQQCARQPDSTVFLLFTGHGACIPAEYSNPARHLAPANPLQHAPHYGFVAADSNPDDWASYVLDQEIGFYLKQIQAAGKFLVFDTCFAQHPIKGDPAIPWSIVAEPPEASRERGPATTPVVITASESLERELRIPSTAPGRSWTVGPVTYLTWSGLFSGKTTCDELDRYLRASAVSLNVTARPRVLSAHVNRAFLDQPAPPTPGGTILLAGAPKKVPRATLLVQVKTPAFVIEGTLKRGEDSNGRLALVVGVDQWSADRDIPPLHGACNDARRIAENLERAGWKVLILTSDAKQPEDQATRANILRCVDELKRRPNLQTFLFYGSMHGMEADIGPGAVNRRAFLLPMDARRMLVRETGLSLEDLAHAVHASNPAVQHLLLATDACQVSADKLLADLTAAAGEGQEWAVITAVGKGQPAEELPANPKAGIPEEREAHGAFTLALLTSTYGRPDPQTGKLRADANPAGDVVSFSEAFDYAVNQLKRLGVKQTPQMIAWHDAEKLPFAKARPIPVPLSPPNPANPDRPAIRADQVDVLKPSDFPNKTWWLYQTYDDAALLPFSLTNWMAGNNNVKDPLRGAWLAPCLMHIDPAAVDHRQPGQGTCIQWDTEWSVAVRGQRQSATWVGLGLVYAQDQDIPWFAEAGDNRGRYYDLRPLCNESGKTPVLKFKAWSYDPSARLQAKVGFLSRDAHWNRLMLGDSLAQPITSVWLPLNATPQEFSLPLTPGTRGVSDGEQNDLSRLCSICFILERVRQSGNPQNPVASSHLFLDDIRIEFDSGPALPAAANSNRRKD